MSGSRALSFRALVLSRTRALAVGSLSGHCTQGSCAPGDGSQLLKGVSATPKFEWAPSSDPVGYSPGRKSFFASNHGSLTPQVAWLDLWVPAVSLFLANIQDPPTAEGESGSLPSQTSGINQLRRRQSCSTQLLGVLLSELWAGWRAEWKGTP